MILFYFFDIYICIPELSQDVLRKGDNYLRQQKSAKMSQTETTRITDGRKSFEVKKYTFTTESIPRLSCHDPECDERIENGV